jgi:hypothetical protein
MAAANTLAYYGTGTITALISFKVCIMKLFMAGIVVIS